MDLGSLELQIFVSLTVVLGGAFVALICDYLKGNNEQLREHNIELRVRKEEQERRMILDPAGFAAQFKVRPGAVSPMEAAVNAAASARPVAQVHEVMQSFAAQEALLEAEERTAALHARVADDMYEAAEVPPVSQRRNSRKGSGRKSARKRERGENAYSDWVRPETIARVARNAAASAAYNSDIRDELDAAPEESVPQPLNAAENWDIREQITPRERAKRPAAPPVEPAVIEPPAPPVERVPEKVEAPVEPRLRTEDVAVLQKEIERVSQLERSPVAPAPGTILRPLTVPALKLEDELHRVAIETAATVPHAPLVWHSPLLEEVIKASAARPVAQQIEEHEFEIAADPVAEVQAEEKAAVETEVVVAPVSEVTEAVAVASTAASELGATPVEAAAAEPIVAEPELPVFEFAEVPAVVVAGEEAALLSGGELPPVAEMAPVRGGELAPAVVVAVEETAPASGDELPHFEFVEVPPVVMADGGELALAVVAADEEAAPVSGGELPHFEFVEVLPVVMADGGEVAPAVIAAAEEAAPVSGGELPHFEFVEVPPVVVAAGGELTPAVVEAAEEAAPVSGGELPHFEFVEVPPVVMAVSGELPPFDFAEWNGSQVVDSPVPVEIMPEIFSCYEVVARVSILAGLGVAAQVEYIPTLPLVETPTASLALRWTGEATEPPPFWGDAAEVVIPAPIDISDVRPLEPAPLPEPVGEPEPVAAAYPDILLPSGMHDLSTWTRLLSLPNPMSGILFVISLQPSEDSLLPQTTNGTAVEANHPAIEKLMASFVREGDFGSRIAQNEWVFVYNHDVAGFNQRRVGMISEKLWDFQLRHLGLANVSFKWGAIDVKSEPISAAIEAARDRMNQTQKARKLPGADPISTRRAVNA